MELTSWLMLAAIAGLASYLQTITGFAFGLIFMSAVAISGVIGIEDGATVVSILVLVNAALVLTKDRAYIAKGPFLQIAPIALATTVIGTLLLPLLLSKSVIWLKFILGAVIVVSSLQLLWLRKGAGERRPNWAFPLSGLIGGMMGGLFAIPGPPIVYALQRYLPVQREIRATLVAIFAAITILRLGLSSVLHPPAANILATAGMLAPVTILATTVAHRWPPPLSAEMLKVITVCLLVLTGILLLWPALADTVQFGLVSRAEAAVT